MIKATLKELFPNVVFGTSGVRARVTDLTPEAISAYITSFITYAIKKGEIGNKDKVIVGIDLRPSSPAIASIICSNIERLGLEFEYAGTVPTPALALRCLDMKAAGIMVTGSHIPFDRNGIKFFLPSGEILKEDEYAICSAEVNVDTLTSEWSKDLPEASPLAAEAYIRRYTQHYGPTGLKGLRIGLYEHSAVGRDIMRTMLENLGATVITLGRSNTFVPIDTEAVSEDDEKQATTWCQKHQLDALVSTDGDGDRPLVFDEQGKFVRGDLLGLICARELGVRSLTVTVNCNTAIERSEAFDWVGRTRIGSPFVIEGMIASSKTTDVIVAGFEANGGFLLKTPIQGLSSLPTRDAMLPILQALSTSLRRNLPVSALIDELPRRFTHSALIKEVPTAASHALVMKLITNEQERKIFFAETIKDLNVTDGLRVTFESGDILHLRPSGNAPELRCYAESKSLTQAKNLISIVLTRAKLALFT